MAYLLAVFLPPVYFFTRKKIGAGIVTTIMFLLSVIFVFTVVLIPVAIIMWFLAAACAGWNLRKEVMEEHATMIAEKMAAKMQQNR